jgi:hypothetical protein
VVTREIKAKPGTGQRPQLDEIHGELYIGTLYVPFLLFEKLNDHLAHSKDGKYRRDRILRLIEAGLQTAIHKDASNKIIMLSQSLRTILGLPRT